MFDFETFLNENRARFPRLRIVLPVSEVDGSSRNSRSAADKSRLEVTSIRWIVEAVHGQQKSEFYLSSTFHQHFFRLAYAEPRKGAGLFQKTFRDLSPGHKRSDKPIRFQPKKRDQEPHFHR